MNLTKQTLIDQITITENGIVLYREVTKILEDEVLISKTYHRSSLVPGQDLTNIPDRVKTICETAWTPEVIEEFERNQK